MKMVMAIVSDYDSILTVDRLNKADFQVTKLASTGGFLKRGNVSLLLGVEDDRVEEACRIIREEAHKRKEVKYIFPTGTVGDMESNINRMVPVDEEKGGVVIFVVDVEKFYKE